MFEVIERDAWSIFEITHKNYSQIDIDNIESDIINESLSKFEDEGIKIKLLNLTADVNIPTIAASPRLIFSRLTASPTIRYFAFCGSDPFRLFAAQ